MLKKRRINFNFWRPYILVPYLTEVIDFTTYLVPKPVFFARFEALALAALLHIKHTLVPFLVRYFLLSFLVVKQLILPVLLGINCPSSCLYTNKSIMYQHTKSSVYMFTHTWNFQWISKRSSTLMW